MSKPVFSTTSDIAQHLGITTQTVRNIVRRHRIPTVVMSSRKFFDSRAVKEIERIARLNYEQRGVFND